jgi:hypothetical protein
VVKKASEVMVNKAAASTAAVNRVAEDTVSRAVEGDDE